MSQPLSRAESLRKRLDEIDSSIASRENENHLLTTAMDGRNATPAGKLGIFTERNEADSSAIMRNNEALNILRNQKAILENQLETL